MGELSLFPNHLTKYDLMAEKRGLALEQPRNTFFSSPSSSRPLVVRPYSVRFVHARIPLGCSWTCTACRSPPPAARPSCLSPVMFSVSICLCSSCACASESPDQAGCLAPCTGGSRVASGPEAMAPTWVPALHLCLHLRGR